MKMFIKRNSILFFFFFIISLFYGQTKNYDQELSNLLSEEKIFEAIDYYGLYHDSLRVDFSKDYYTIMTDMFLNRPDSAVIHIPEFIQKYHGNIFDDEMKRHFINMLLNVCTRSGNGKAGSQALNDLIPFIKSSSIFNQTREIDLKNVETLKKMYSMFMEKDFFYIPNENTQDDIRVNINTDQLIYFDGGLNGKTHSVLFDTGFSYPLVMTKKVADSLELKMLEEYSPKKMNNIEVNSAFGLLDSLKIGSLTIRNVPVYVFEDFLLTRCFPDLENQKKLENSIELGVILGLPLMKRLGRIELDMEKEEMIISLNHKVDNSLKPNIYTDLNDMALYVKGRVNSQDITLFFDTGGSLDKYCMMIKQEFYKKNQFAFELKEKRDSLDFCGIEGSTRYLFNKSKSLIFEAGSHSVDLHNETMILSGEEDSHIVRYSKEGFLGFGFLRKIKSVTFDFNSMHIDFIPQ